MKRPILVKERVPVLHESMNRSLRIRERLWGTDSADREQTYKLPFEGGVNGLRRGSGPGADRESDPFTFGLHAEYELGRIVRGRRLAEDSSLPKIASGEAEPRSATKKNLGCAGWKDTLVLQANWWEPTANFSNQLEPTETIHGRPHAWQFTIPSPLD